MPLPLELTFSPGRNKGDRSGEVSACARTATWCTVRVVRLVGYQCQNFPEKTPPTADKLFVRAFLQQADDILDIAVHGDGSLQDVAILIDRQGGMRMLDPSGWSLPALGAEYGAMAVYKVERRGASVRVEGWDGSQRCLVQRNSRPTNLFHLPGTVVAPQAMTWLLA